VLDSEPIVDTSINTQSTQFNVVFSDNVTIGNIFIEDLKEHVITNILNINVDELTRP
jgi:hypothetical protein